MPVDNKHEGYVDRFLDWALLRDAIAGERVIKAAGVAYLPKLIGQRMLAYNSYKARGTFFNALSRTVQGLTGAIMRKPPAVEVPNAMEDLMENATPEGLSFEEVARNAVDAVLSYGRYGILVDVGIDEGSENDELPYMAGYAAGDILNWKVDRSGREDKLTMLVLREMDSKYADDDEFKVESTEQMRVYKLSEDDGFLEVTLYEKVIAGGKATWAKVGEVINPSFKGNRLDFIPFVFFGAVGNTIAVQKPPLLDLGNLNIKHWQITVDYYHGLHYCALPTPWAAGFPIESKLYIGPGKAWVASDPNAKAGFLEFTGQGLGAVEKGLDKLEKKMAVLGARMLEEQKRAVETAESLRLRVSGDTATLSNVASSVEGGLEKVLRLAAWWMSIEKDDVSCSLNKDFVNEKLSAQDISALMQAYMNDMISMDTFLYNLQQGEILPESRTIEEERKLIDMDKAEEFDEEGNAIEEEEEEEEEE